MRISDWSSDVGSSDLEKGRVRLSETGQRLLPAIRAAFASMGDAFAAIGDDEAEVLTINAAVTFGGTWHSARIGRFQLRYPDLSLRLSMSNDYFDFDASTVDLRIRIHRGGLPVMCAHSLFRPLFPPTL